MDKNLHKLDDIFNKAYQQFEEEPSEMAWQKLNASLDKEDAEKYKKRFIGWKRVAILLLFLLSGLVIYESRMFLKVKSDRAAKSAATDSVYGRKKINETDIAGTNHTNQKKIKNKGISSNTDQPVTQSKENNSLAKKEFKKTATPNTKKDFAVLPVLPLKRKYRIANADIKKETKLSENILAKKKNKHSTNEQTIASSKNNLKQTGSNRHDAVTEIAFTKILPQNRTTAVLRERFSGIKISPLNSNSILSSALSSISNNTATKISTKPFKAFWAVFAFGSRDWGQNQLYNDEPDNSGSNHDEKEEVTKRESHQGSFSGGILVTRQFSKQWGFKTGFIYSQAIISIAPQQIFATKEPNGKVAYRYVTSSGYGYVNPGFGLSPSVGDSLQSTMAQHYIKSISIPFMLTYRLQKNKFFVIPSVGLTANFITHARVQTEVTDALNREAVTINGLNGMRNFYAGFIADLNFQYMYNNRWSVNLFPGFKYALTSITERNVVKTYPYSFGIGAGITYKF